MKMTRFLSTAVVAAATTIVLSAPAFAAPSAAPVPTPLPTLNFIGSIVVKVVQGGADLIGLPVVG